MALVNRLRMKAARWIGRSRLPGANRLIGLLYTPGIRMRAVTILRDGTRFEVDTGSGLGRSLWIFGAFEANLQALLRAQLGRGDVFVDVGANIGVHTCALARHVGRHGLVIAVEPLAETVAQLRRNIELNQLQNVVVVEQAAGPEAGEAGIYPPISDTALALASLSYQDGLALRPTMVKIDRLDSIVRGVTQRRIALIKIDVEDHELGVFQGARELLVMDRPIVYFEHRIGRAGGEVDAAKRLLQIEAELSAHGYAVVDSLTVEYGNRMMVAVPLATLPA